MFPSCPSNREGGGGRSEGRGKESVALLLEIALELVRGDPKGREIHSHRREESREIEELNSHFAILRKKGFTATQEGKIKKRGRPPCTYLHASLCLVAEKASYAVQGRAKRKRIDT